MSTQSRFIGVPPPLVPDAAVSDIGVNGSVILVATGPDTVFSTPTGSKAGLFGVTPVVQPTTAIASSVVAGTGTGTILASTTFDGYTIGQVVAALKTVGILSSA